jgi:hypothetical protein
MFAVTYECKECDPMDEEGAILAYLTGTVSLSEQEQTRAALAILAHLAHEVSAANGMTEDEFADRFDAVRRTAGDGRNRHGVKR